MLSQTWSHHHQWCPTARATVCNKCYYISVTECHLLLISQQQCLLQLQPLVAVSVEGTPIHLHVSSPPAPSFFIWTSCDCMMTVAYFSSCLCDFSQQWGPHLASLSAAQRSGLLHRGPDADAHLPSHRHSQSCSTPGYVSALQPPTFRYDVFELLWSCGLKFGFLDCFINLPPFNSAS